MAAGLGFKTFTTGEVLTAADTNGYLMQGVLVFASSAARAAAITSPQEGQYSYLKDTNSTEYYDGAAWIAAPIGDITGVTAGTGISGGGTSGTVTVTNSMATEIAAKGDLIVGTGAATFDNLTVGTNGQTLVADSSTATGLKWATPTSAEPVSFWARQSSSQSFTASTWTKIDFGSEQFDSDNYFASSRFTPLKAGYYDLTADLSFEGSGSGLNILAIYKNGAIHRAINRYNTDGNCIISASGMVFLNGSTDYAEIYAYSTRTTPSIGIADSNGFNGTFIHS